MDQQDREGNNPWKRVARLEKESATLRGKLKHMGQRMQIMCMQQAISYAALKSQVSYLRTAHQKLLSERREQVPFWHRGLVKELEEKRVRAEEGLAHMTGELERARGMLRIERIESIDLHLKIQQLQKELEKTVGK